VEYLLPLAYLMWRSPPISTPFFSVNECTSKLQLPPSLSRFSFPLASLHPFFLHPIRAGAIISYPHYSPAWRRPRTLIANGEVLRFTELPRCCRVFLPPLLPPSQSWYPGHMTQFSRMLPSLLERTDVVLDLRDARLSLTSINSTQNAHGNQARGIILLHVSSNSQTVL